MTQTSVFANLRQAGNIDYSEGFTDSDLLAEALLTQPELANNIIRMFGDKYHLQYLTQGSGRVSNKYDEVGNSEFKWGVEGKSSPTFKVVGNSEVGLAGAGHSRFILSFDRDIIPEGALLKFGSGFDTVQVRVQEVLGADSEGYRYALQINAAESTTLAADLYAIGSECSILALVFEEGSDEAGSMQSFPFWLQNQTTIHRLSSGVTGSAASDKCWVMFNAETKTKVWTSMREWRMMRDFMDYQERLRWYGVYNKDSSGKQNLRGKNGRFVKTGAGVHQQIASTNKITYSPGSLTENVVEEFMMELLAKSNQSENKHFFAFTGRGGFMEFKRAIKQMLSEASLVTGSDNYLIHKVDGGKTMFGNDYETYLGLFGCKFTIVRLGLYDDDSLQTVRHSRTGLPLESYRFTVLDFSDYDGEANISLKTKAANGINRSLLQWYTPGSTDPGQNPSPKSGGAKIMRSSAYDGYQCHMLSETAIKIANPLSCGEMICVDE